METLSLQKDQQRELLKYVRCILEEKLTGIKPATMPVLQDEVFSKKYGIFVTLTIKGVLRGCIGIIEGRSPLREAAGEMAVQSALHDPRFKPLTVEELSQVKIEVSILYPPEQLGNPSEIKIGRDGLIIEKGYHRGLLLPQVAVEHAWGVEEFMNQTCRKAGLESFCWENGAKVSRFEAVVFQEEQEV